MICDLLNVCSSALSGCIGYVKTRAHTRVMVKLHEQCEAPGELVGVTINTEEDEAENQMKNIRLGCYVRVFWFLLYKMYPSASILI